MLGAAVPKASVHKNRNTELSKEKVRLPKDPLISSPADDPEHPEHFDQSQFRFQISA
jgi:hypothetical protein